MAAVSIVTRSGWAALEPRSPVELFPPVANLVLAYARTDRCHSLWTCRTLLLQEQRRQMQTRMATDIAFNFMLDDTGTIYEGRGFYNTPSLPVKLKPLERQSLYIAFMGEDPRAEMDGGRLYIVKRAEWGAEGARRTSVLDNAATNVFVTYTGKNPCSNNEWCVFAMRKLQQMHIYSRGCPDIRYNFCIGGDGLVYEGRGWYTRPTLPKKYSDYTTSSLLIALMGNFLKERPGDRMYEALDDLLLYGVRKQYIGRKFLQFRI